MRRGVLAVGLTIALILQTRGSQCGAQTALGPVFRLQPGLLSTDFISAPDGIRSGTGFNLRFETRLPTSIHWLTPVIGASITPYGNSGPNGSTMNAATIFAGNVFPLVEAKRTSGWATVDLPFLYYYSYGGGGEHNPRLYGRDLILQLALTVHLGAKTLRDLGSFWPRLDGFGFIEQNLTPNRQPDGKTDRFNPVAMVGVSIPFGEHTSP